MEFQDYQRDSTETAGGYANPFPNDIPEEQKAMFLALAINGEAGELAEKVKKGVREGQTVDSQNFEADNYFREAEDEIGDILWYMTQLATLLDVWMDTLAERNLDKLQDRDERDKIFGDGDNR